MKVYIYLPRVIQGEKLCARGGTCLVKAELSPADDAYSVHHPIHGYSIWPADQFEEVHRELTAKERSLINMSTAELEVMGISDNAEPLV